MASDAFLLADAFLSAIEAWYTAHPLLTPLPARRYIAPGQPSHDCEQVTVQVARRFNTAFQPEQEAPDARLAINLLAAELRIEVIRCIPAGDDAGNPAPAADLTAAASVQDDDAEAMHAAVLDGVKNGDLPGCDGVTPMGWESIGPEGGVGGGATVWRVTF